MAHKDKNQTAKSAFTIIAVDASLWLSTITLGAFSFLSDHAAGIVYLGACTSLLVIVVAVVFYRYRTAFKCPSCGRKRLGARPGRYICSACRCRFIMDGEGRSATLSPGRRS